MKFFHLVVAAISKRYLLFVAHFWVFEKLERIFIMIYVLYHYATNFMVSAESLVVSEPTARIPIIWSISIPAFFDIELTYCNKKVIQGR